MRAMLGNLVQGLIRDSLGDIPVEVVLQSTTLGSYDPILGKATRTITEYRVKAVVVGITDRDTNDVELLTKGKKALIAGDDIPGVNIDALDDTVKIGDQTYKLKSYKVDPTGALYSLMLVARTPNGL